MGSKFDLIADNALKTVSDAGECSFCGARDVPIYNIEGFDIEPGQYIFEKFPEEEGVYEMEYACEDCIKSGRIKLFSENDFEDVVKKYCREPEASVLKLRKTPSIPFCIQGDDWAVCCGELCEFTGIPQSYKESIALVDTHQFWSRGPQNWKTFWSFEFTLEPESLREVSTFRCSHCGKEWFIWQSS